MISCGIYYFVFQRYFTDSEYLPYQEAKVPEAPLTSAQNLRGDAGSATDGASKAAAGSQLRTEVAQLRQLIEKHDQMIRYIMNHFVEKDRTAQADIGRGIEDAVGDVRPEVKAAEHQSASPVTDEKQGISAASRADASRRKRRGEDVIGGLDGFDRPASSVSASDGAGGGAVRAGSSAAGGLILG